MGLSLVCIVQFLSVSSCSTSEHCRLPGLAWEEPLRDADPGLGLVIVGDRTSRAFVPLEIDAGQVPAGSLWDEGFISGGRMVAASPSLPFSLPNCPKAPGSPSMKRRLIHKLSGCEERCVCVCGEGCVCMCVCVRAQASMLGSP